MKKSIIFILLMLMLPMTIGSASAFTADFQYYPSPVFNDFSWARDGGVVGFNINGLEGHAWVNYTIDLYTAVDNTEWERIYTRTWSSLNYYGDAIQEDGDYEITIPEKYFPWNHKAYRLNFTGECSDGTWGNDSLEFVLGDEDYKKYNVGIADFTPYHLNMHGVSALKGVTFSIISNSTIPVKVFCFICNNVSKALSWGKRDVVFGKNDINLTWNDVTLNKEIFDVRKGYYVYIGFDMAEGFTEDNLRITTDGTSMQLNFSMDRFSKKWDEVFPYNHDHTFDYIGVMSRFSTFPAQGEQGTGWSPDVSVPTIGVIIRDWGVSAGLPFFHIVLACIVIILFICIPLHFSLRWNKSLPNFVYGIATVSAMIVNWTIGIIDLWMMIFFMLIILLVVYMKYKEQISGLISYVRPQVESATSFAETDAYRAVRRTTDPYSESAQRKYQKQYQKYKDWRRSPKQKRVPAVEKVGRLIAKKKDGYKPLPKKTKDYLKKHKPYFPTEGVRYKHDKKTGKTRYKMKLSDKPPVYHRKDKLGRPYVKDKAKIAAMNKARRSGN